MTGRDAKLRIGFIPLADAAALIVAADRGFTAAEGLDVELVREVSWSNVRDKLNIGLFDAAHLIAPIAIASSLGIGHVKVPIVAPFGLGVNGNAITVSPALYAAIKAEADGDILDPMVSARALKRVVERRKAKGEEPLALGMTFPFSTHNYHIRFWMAAGGVDPDEDVRLVVLPPPYMVDSLASGHVDGFCVGAPWNSVAVDLGIGVILHFVCEILERAMEKLLAVRAGWAEENPDVAAAPGAGASQGRGLHRGRGQPRGGRGHPLRTQPHRRRRHPGRAEPPDVAAEVIRRTLDGRMKVAPDGTVRTDKRYLLVGRDGAARPDPRADRMALRADGALGSGAAVAGAAGRGQGRGAPRPLRRRVCPDSRDRVGSRAGRWHWRLRRTRLRCPTTSPDTSRRWRLKRCSGDA